MASTSLNLLVTVLDGRCDVVCDVSCCLLVDAARVCLIVIECLLVECFVVFAVLCALGVTVGDDASVRSTSPSAPIFSPGKGEHISCL